MRMRKKKSVQWGAILLLAVSVMVFFTGCGSQESRKSVLQQLQEKNGYIRTVGKEEYDFFRKLTDRDTAEDVSEEELDVLTREYINRSNAEFMIGNQMGLCNPYSFESFQRDMENENAQRKQKKENKEVFYGPESFDLITYYTYVRGNLTLDMVNFIIAQADAEVIKGSKAYFEEHKENYRTIESIQYELKEDGVVTNEELIREEMSTLEKTDGILFSFLYQGQENDTFQYSYGDKAREVRIVAVEYKSLSFENNQERVMRDYVTKVYLEDWIHMVETEYPVDYESD